VARNLAVHAKVALKNEEEKMSFEPKITLFSCHYASQQSCAEHGKELQQLGFPATITMVGFPVPG